MHFGYQQAQALDDGAMRVEIRAIGMVRYAWGRDRITVACHPGQPVRAVLRKLLNYAPELRSVMFDQRWADGYSDQHDWIQMHPVYRLKPGWRVQHNGRYLHFYDGFDTPLEVGDTLVLASPGR